MYDGLNGVAIKTLPNLQCWGVKDDHCIPYDPQSLMRLLRIGGDLYFIRKGVKKAQCMLDRPDVLPSIAIEESFDRFLFVPYFLNQPIPLGEHFSQPDGAHSAFEIVQLSFYEIVSICEYRQNVVFRQGLHVVTSSSCGTNVHFRPPVRYLRTAVNKAGRLVHWKYAVGSKPENYATMWGIRLPFQHT